MIAQIGRQSEEKLTKMITPTEREELRALQLQLKQFFPAAKHKVREIPGSPRKWIYLPWQAIRERLDEIAPDWMSDFSEIQYIGNDAICRGAITIMGIRKEAIASVPISIQSKAGNEMTRGSAADRLYAEAMKNASESWGLGAYLDDQVTVIRYLWDNRHSLSDEMEGEIRKLFEQYKKELSAPVSRNNLQAKRFWAVAKGECKLDDEVAKAVYKAHGFSKTEEITTDKYELIISQLKQVMTPVIATPQPDRNLLNAEIESVMNRKGISTNQARAMLQDLFNARGRQQLSDKQLQEFLEYLRTVELHAAVK